MADIFISYARADRDKVRPLAKALEAKGWSVWWDARIRSGEAFDRVIEKALAEARCVVAVWSANSVESDWVRAEATYGLQREILISVAIEQNVRPPLRFLYIHTEPLFDWDGKRPSHAFTKIISDIETIIGSPSPTEKAIKAVVEIQDISGETEPHHQKESINKQIIQPDLDAMVEVPAGEFIYQTGKDRIERPYKIDIYPVTNSQFERFIKAGGYQNVQYWSKEGQEWLRKKKPSNPEWLNDEDFNKPDHPVVGVSYYEAEAYAAWIGKRIPTERQWERVACGTDGRGYPWGDEFNHDRCNTAESGFNKTTNVSRYSSGASLLGCYDLAGNVREWTSSWFDDMRSGRVLRGGSWKDNRSYARCASRKRRKPTRRTNFIGFRCAKDI